MSYSQKPLIALFKAGNVPGESGVPEHIETVISNVFLFPERVYKLYKDDNVFFNSNYNDLSQKSNRLEFSRADFDWNKQISPEIYLDLKGVRGGKDFVEFISEQNAEELICITKRMPHSSTLIDLLMKGEVSTNAWYEIGWQFAERESRFNQEGATPDESALENMRDRYDDIVEWIRDVKEVPQNEKEVYMSQLKQLLQPVYEANTEQLSPCFDIHSLNAFYVAGMLLPFDTYSPKDSWRFGPRGLNIFRLATDIYALRGEEEFRAVLKGYCEFLGIEPFTDEMTNLLVLYASLIMLPYLYMLSATDNTKRRAATRYHDFLKRYTSSTLAV
jgi:aminoglycoside phosphotransferase family enzyme